MIPLDPLFFVGLVPLVSVLLPLRFSPRDLSSLALLRLSTVDGPYHLSAALRVPPTPDSSFGLSSLCFGSLIHSKFLPSLPCKLRGVCISSTLCFQSNLQAKTPSVLIPTTTSIFSTTCSLFLQALHLFLSNPGQLPSSSFPCSLRGVRSLFSSFV